MTSKIYINTVKNDCIQKKKNADLLFDMKLYTCRSAKFAEFLSGLRCDEAQAEHRTIRVGFWVIMAP